MILTKASKHILSKLPDDRHLICKYFGYAKPHCCQIDDPQWRIYYKDPSVLKYIAVLLSYTTDTVIDNKLYDSLSQITVKILSETDRFIHFCRLLSYLVHETWIPETGEAEGLSLCAFVIASSIEYTISKILSISKKCLRQQINDGKLCRKQISPKRPGIKINPQLLNNYMKRYHESSLLKIHNMLSESHPRHPCLLMKSRYTLQHKPLTGMKRKLSSNENLIASKRLSQGLNTNTIHNAVKPSPNFALNLAIVELCFMQAAKLSSYNLFSFLTSLGQVPLDVDVNYVLSGLIDMARNRLRVKFVEVNEEYCTCHTKCCGYDFSRNLRHELEEKALKRHATIFCCQRCMLTPLVRHTKARKPRMKICSSNPALETCSLDNCSTFRDISLYNADYKGFGVFKYQHLFYMTNIVNVIEELSGKKATGPSSQLYGMCYGGSRICFSQVRGDLKSSLDVNRQITSCYDKERYMCTNCLNKNVYTAHSGIIISCLYGKNILDVGTCIELSINELERGLCMQSVMNKICTGCKLKFLCHHAMPIAINGLLSFSCEENQTLYKKAIYRVQLVKSLILYLLSHNE